MASYSCVFSKHIVLSSCHDLVTKPFLTQSKDFQREHKRKYNLFAGYQLYFSAMSITSDTCGLCPITALTCSHYSTSNNTRISQLSMESINITPLPLI